MRISPTPAIGLLASHTALVTGVHGVTGDIVGTTDTQTLTNKIITNLAITNVGVGANPTLSANSAYQTLGLTGNLLVTLDVMNNGNLMFKSSTAFWLILQHTLTAQRTATFPDADITVVGRDLAQLLKNKSIRSLAIDNEGAGTDPVLGSNSAAQTLSLTGGLIATAGLMSNTNVELKAGTAFWLTLTHAITAARTATFPDKDITVFGTVDEKVIQVIPLADLEASVGTPALANETGSDTAITDWTFDAQNERVRTKETFTPPEGFNKLKIQALVHGDGETNEWEFSYSLVAGGVTSAGTGDAVALAVLESSEIAVNDNQVVRLFLEWNKAAGDGFLYGFKLIWYQ